MPYPVLKDFPKPYRSEGMKNEIHPKKGEAYEFNMRDVSRLMDEGYIGPYQAPDRERIKSLYKNSLKQVK